MNRRHPFRMRSALAQHELDFGPNMTPMVDIVMVILIFFMGATAFTGAEWYLNIALPTPAAATDAPADPFALPPARFDLRLTHSPPGPTRWTGLGQTDQPIDTLPAALERIASAAGTDALEIVLIPDAATPYADVVRAADLCSGAGLRVIGIAP